MAQHTGFEPASLSANRFQVGSLTARTCCVSGAPSRTLTYDLPLRRRLFYTAELWAQILELTPRLELGSLFLTKEAFYHLNYVSISTKTFK